MVGWAWVVTSLQLLQMVSGMVVLIFSWVQINHKLGACGLEENNILFGLAIYFSYFLLFLHFAVLRYCKNPWKKNDKLS